jgi:hypothetical protein
MKKLLVIGGIGLVIIVILAVVVSVVGIRFISANFPELIAGVEKITGIAIERAKEVSPEISERIEGIIPGEEMPTTDVGGEDIAGIPRYPNMVRVSFEVKDGKKTVGYKGEAEFNAVLDFYTKEMAALQFEKKVLSASTVEEVHEYRKGTRVLEARFTKVDRLGTAITEMVMREL